jgi:hypothetical protein
MQLPVICLAIRIPLGDLDGISADLLRKQMPDLSAARARE